MKRSTRRRAAMQAERRLAQEYDDWRGSANRLRAHYARHGPRWLVGGGLMAGAAFERLPLRSLGAFARLCLGVTSFVLRLPFGSLLAGRLAAEASTYPARESAKRDSP